MQVRCVECHEPIDVAEDTQFGSMTCPSCGSAFSLLGEETIAYDGKPGDDADFVVRKLGHFELIDLLGSGSFGSVWMARDTELDRTVAIKIPRKGQLNPAEAEQFLREARAAAQLQHPNIVTVHEVGREDDTVYIVNDFVRGMPMDDWIAEQQITQREAAGICAKVADALHHAHEAGITHRDLKPGNIMIDLASEPHIMDFGLAKREVGEVTMTVDGRILGTPAYMPPEQARGEGHKADRRSDIYSLGVILYRLLTGELPFRGSPQMLIMQILNEEPPAPRKLDGRVARDLETVCLKCIEKAPEARYQSAAEVASELRRWLAGEPIVARPITRTERLWRWAKRNPGVAGLTGAVAALLLVIAVGSLVAAARLAVARDDALTAQGKAEQSAQDAKRAQAEAEKAEEEAVQSAKQAKQEKERADKNATIADTQRELAVGALGTLVDEVQKILDDTPRMHQTKRRLIETALAGLSEVAGAAGDRPIEADRKTASAHDRMGELFIELGKPELARDEYAKSYEIRKLLFQQSPGLQARWDLSIPAIRLGRAHLLLGQRDRALEYCEESLALRQEIAKQFPDKLGGAVNKQVWGNVAAAHVAVGDALRDLARTDEAREHYEQALAIQGEMAENAQENQRAARNAALRRTYDRLGELHFVWLGDPQTAKDYYMKSLGIAEERRNADPGSFAARQTVAIAYENLGKVTLRQKDPTASQRYYQQSLELLQQLATEEDPEILLVQGELALVLARVGRHEEAAQAAERIREIAPEFVRNLYNVACCYALCAAAVANGTDPEQLAENAHALWRSYADQAAEALRACVAAGLHRNTYLRIDPDLDAIRHVAEFQTLLERLGD